MTTPVLCLGKLLCITLFAIPSSSAYVHTNSALTTRTTHTKVREATGRSSSKEQTLTVCGNWTKFSSEPNSRTLKAKSIRFAAARRAAAARQAKLRMIRMEAHLLYEDLQLSSEGLDEKVLQYALIGYHRLLKRNEIQNPDILTICDFSQPSSQKRMYVIDLYAKKLVSRNYVAHGIRSGKQFASCFSNTPESHKSSLGFYVTRNTYIGENGLSLRLDGFDRGFNTLASRRNIVIHGAPYVSDRILEKYGVMGTSYGCPAIPEELTRDLIPVLTGGSCFFIYYPSQRYLSHSSVLNG